MMSAQECRPEVLYYMKKNIPLPSVSLGSEPDIPDSSLLMEYVSSYRGIEADLITFQMLRSCSAQLQAGITEIAVGGRYCRPRFLDALSWDEEQGPLIHPDTLRADYSVLIRSGGILCSVHESPAVLASCPNPDNEDAYAEFFHGFRQVLRTLRDIRISGHIIHLKDPISLELELLAGPKTLLCIDQPSQGMLEELLEYTADLVIPADTISVVGELMDRYEIRTLILSQGDECAHNLSEALQYVDPDHIKVAGYGVGLEEEYWKKVKESAVICV
jgi:hypothetical protein